jgi:hypothetical protein
MTNEIAQPSDDNLVCPEVGSWTEDKHRVVSLYTTMFSKGMKAKWGKRAYVEFYAGAAYSRIRGTQKIIYGFPAGVLLLRSG